MPMAPTVLIYCRSCGHSNPEDKFPVLNGGRVCTAVITENPVKICGADEKRLVRYVRHELSKAGWQGPGGGSR